MDYSIGRKIYYEKNIGSIIEYDDGIGTGGLWEQRAGDRYGGAGRDGSTGDERGTPG